MNKNRAQRLNVASQGRRRGIVRIAIPEVGVLEEEERYFFVSLDRDGTEIHGWLAVRDSGKKGLVGKTFLAGHVPSFSQVKTK